MKVIHVLATNLLSSSVGGSGTYIREYFKNRRSDMQLALVGAVQDSEAEVGKWIKEEINGRRFDFFPILHLGRKDYTYHGGIPSNALFIFRLWRYHQQFLSKNAIVHIHRPELAIPFVIPTKRYPIVLTIHGVGNQISITKTHPFFKRRWFRSFYFLLEDCVIKKADRVILVSQEGKKYYLNKFPDQKKKFTYIPTSVDTILFKPMNKSKLRRKYGFFDNEKIAMFVGRFHEQKGINLLIDAFAELKKQIPKARLVLVGDGILKRSLEEQIERLQLHDVTFMGIVGHDRLPEVLNCADVFVLPSLWEGMSIAVLEALSCGIPVVSTNVGQMKEVVKEGISGFIIEKRCATLLMEKIKSALSLAPRMSVHCRQIGERYSSSYLARKIEEIYEGMQSNGLHAD